MVSTAPTEVVRGDMGNLNTISEQVSISQLKGVAFTYLFNVSDV